MFSPEFELVLKLGSGILWTLTYIILIRLGFKEKTFGMPIAALSANIAWEFIFSFVFPHGKPQIFINYAWFAFDLVIVYQAFRYGKPHFQKLLPKNFFYPTLIGSLILGFLLVYGITVEFDNFVGGYAAFGQNLMMSILFVVMLLRRGDVSGQSIYAAIFKMVGTIMPSLLFFGRDQSSLLMNTLYLSIFAFDGVYVWLLYAKHKELEINAWRRF